MKYQNLSKFSLPAGFRGASIIKVQLWWLTQSILFATSPQFMYGWRNFLLRSFGARIGRNVIIRPSVKVTYPWKLSVGDNSWVGDNVTLYTLGEISIGTNSVVSQGSYLCTGSHDYTAEYFDIYAKPICIEDEVWIATDVFVAPGVTIQKGSIVGARSTVLSDLPEGVICFGNPAKPVKKRVINEDHYK